MTAPVNVAVGDLITAADHNNQITWWDGTPHAYTPALTGSTTNPTLGTGSSQVGRYRQVGKQVIGELRILFGTSGAAAGSGTYIVSTPVAGVTSPVLAGHGYVKCAGLYTELKLVWTNPNQWLLRYPTAAVNGSWQAVTNAAPGVFTNGDEIAMQFQYEAS